MSSSGFVILLIIVGVLALSAWPICVMMARRGLNQISQDEELRLRPPREDQLHGAPAQVHGAVMGGVHVGGGRSVAPRRDEAVVVPGQRAAGATSTPETHR